MLAAASPSSTNGGAGGRHPSVRSSYSNELDYGRDAARAGARHKGGGKSHHSPGYGGGSRLDSRARRYSGAASERRTTTLGLFLCWHTRVTLAWQRWRRCLLETADVPSPCATEGWELD